MNADNGSAFVVFKLSMGALLGHDDDDHYVVGFGSFSDSGQYQEPHTWHHAQAILFCSHAPHSPIQEHHCTHFFVLKHAQTKPVGCRILERPRHDISVCVFKVCMCKWSAPLKFYDVDISFHSLMVNVSLSIPHLLSTLLHLSGKEKFLLVCACVCVILSNLPSCKQ